MPVRVLRLLEYVFSDQETAEKHTANWGMPANGIKRIAQHNGRYQGDGELSDSEIVIRSATLPQETIVEDETPIPPEQKAWFENTGQPVIAHCPACGSGETVRLLRNFESAPSVPIIACGNAWHYTFPPEPKADEQAKAGSRDPDDGHDHYFACLRCGVDPAPVAIGFPAHAFVQRKQVGCGFPTCNIAEGHPIHSAIGPDVSRRFESDDARLGRALRPGFEEAMKAHRFAQVYEGAKAAITQTIADGTQGMRRGPLSRAVGDEPEADPGWPPQDSGS